jgi:hypothetical protein
MSGLKYIGFSYTHFCSDNKVSGQTMAHDTYLNCPFPWNFKNLEDKSDTGNL